MPTVNLAPDTEQAAIQRRRLLAQALQQQAMQPIEGPNVPGANISPWQGVSQIANALMAGLINRKLDKRQSALDEKQDTERTAATNAMLQALIPQTPGSSMSVPMAPTQAAPVPMDIGSDVLGPDPEAQQPEGSRMLALPADQSGRASQLSSLAKALASNNPQIQQIAQASLQELLSRAKEDRGNQMKIAELLQTQGFQGGQNALTQEGENKRLAQELAQRKEIADAQLGQPAEVSPGASLMSKQTGAILGTAPGGGPQRTPTEYDQRLAAFNADPALVKQFGSGPMGLDAKEKADAIAKAVSSKSDDETVINYSENGENKTGLLNKKTKQITEVKTPGGGTAGPKMPEPPAAIKTQGTAAITALKQVDNITSIIAANPQLIGPIAGRFQQFMQGTGANPFVGTKDEKLGATLAEHLNALFAQELRSMFPGRTNEQMQELIKSTSAQMKQNPNMMLGMLEGIKKNESMVLETAKQQGFNPDRMGGSSGKKADPLGIR